MQEAQRLAAAEEAAARADEEEAAIAAAQQAAVERAAELERIRVEVSGRQVGVVKG